jgi:glycosyltransferase involved in cell wall biosynthesis
VITTGVGGIDETVENGVQGIIIPQNDEESLLHAIVRLRGDSALYERMSRAARTRAENLLDVEKNAARIVDIMRTSTLTAGHQRIHAHV